MAQTRGRFEQIYDAHVVAIYRFIHARVGNRPDAEDLTAQVFMRAVEQLDTTRDEGQIVAWLYRVSQNAIADYWRAFYRLPLVGTEQVAPETIHRILADKDLFDFTPLGIIERLDLRTPIYGATAAYGHFGRPSFSWERTDLVDAIRGEAGL